ncbi:Hypothetical predicted protein [Lecanosticta acicola]|uniref:Uncharacterized protein n=1 Tax=Lecanosticta acicola TaxID=111012 RepID=A0AAI8Z5B6_9PEZI|nr:Hypothetical predicted protein [Lecanosticta acicola]
MDTTPLERRVITTVDENGVTYVETKSGSLKRRLNGEHRVLVCQKVATPPAIVGEDREETRETIETRTIVHERSERVRIDLRVQYRHFERAGANITNITVPPDFTTAFVFDATSLLRGNGDVEVRQTQYLPPDSSTLERLGSSRYSSPRHEHAHAHARATDRNRHDPYTLYRSSRAYHEYGGPSRMRPNPERQVVKYEGGYDDVVKYERGHDDVVKYERGYDDREHRHRYSAQDHVDEYNRERSRRRLHRERSSSPVRAPPLRAATGRREPSSVDRHGAGDGGVVLQKAPGAGSGGPKKRKTGGNGNVRAQGSVRDAE